VSTVAKITLWRPAGPAELWLIEVAGFRAFSTRLLEQPVFYPVLNQACAVQIARDWNVEAGDAAEWDQIGGRHQDLL
jgi:hypothetical protein